MNELSERARELAEEVIHETKFVDVVESVEIVRLIEQALLAERRLAMEEAAKIAGQWANSASCDVHEYDPCCHVRTGAGIADALRAAAEKEVGTK